MSLVFVLGTRGPQTSTVSGGIRDGYVDEDNGYQPADTTVEIWMKSDVIWGNQDGHQYEKTDECGDDDGAGTENDPIKSFRELERRLRGGFGQGCHVIVYLMGHGGPDFDNPDEGRLYYSREARISYGNGSPESYRASISYIGPRGMLPQSGPYKLSSASDVSNGGRRVGKTRLAFTQGGFAAGVTADTYHLRWLRSDGREVIAPFGVTKNVVDGSVHTSVAAAATITGYSNASDDWYVVIPAVAIAADELDNQFKGVHIVGDGPYRIGDRESAESPVNDVNQYPHFERVAFVGRTTVNVNGDLRVDTCNFRDDLHVGPGVGLRARGNCIEGVLYYNGGPVFRTASAQFDPRIDASCRMLEYDPEQALDTQRNTLTSDPDDAITGQDWSISGQGAGVVVGDDLGGYSASLRILKGIAVNCEQGSSVGFKVYSRCSLYVANAARVCVTAIDSSGVMFWGVDRASMRINDGPCPIVQGGTPADFAEYAGPAHYGSTNDVKVGNEVAVAFGTSAGQFREVAGINGNYVSDYDHARAWTPESEPSAYGKAGG